KYDYLYNTEPYNLRYNNGTAETLDSSLHSNHWNRQKENRSMLRISTETKRGKRILSVEGRLAGPWVSALEQCWREVRAASSAEKVSVNLCGVSFIDAAGKVLLKEIHRQGGRLVAEGCLNQAIVREIVGSEEEEQHRNDRGDSSKGPHVLIN